MRLSLCSSRIVFHFALLLLVCVPALAQLPTATLNGTVADPQGGVVPGARVILTNQATGISREATTDTQGRYTFANLSPGLYTIRVEASGFRGKEHKDVRLEVGRATTLDVGLELGQVDQKVTVEGGAAQLELTQSQVQGQITATTIESLPLNGRNFLELAFLIPGNRPATNFDPTKTNTLEVSSAGAFGRGGNITVDGGDNNDEVVGGTLMNLPQDSVQEFQIATNRFTAEVGRSGSSIINIITKSGANELHGSAFAYFRDKTLQGLPATFNRSQPTPPFDRQQVGGSLGGPFRKDQSWWFFSLENRNQDHSVPAGFRDFTLQDIVGGSALAFIDDFLLTGRVDFQVSSKDKMSGRYAFNRAEDVDNGSLRSPQGTAANRQQSLNRFSSALYDWTRTVGTNRVNSLIFHINTFLNSIPAFTDNNPVTDVPIAAVAGTEIRFPRLQDGANFRIPQRTRFNRYQLRDTFGWVAGSHNIRFGGEWQAQRSDALFDLFGSSTIFTTEDFATADRNADTLIDDRDIPVALVVRSRAPIRPPFVPDIDNHYFGFFFQDDWRLRPSFTVNLGLRWEFDSDVLGVAAAHRPCSSIPAPPDERCVWITPVLPPPFGPLKRDRDLNNLGPRIGFAWDPFSKGQTVIRGGYGIYYDRIVLEVRLLELLLDGRLLPLEVLSSPTALLEDPFVGTSTPLPIGINFIENDTANPYVQQFNFGVQHQIGRDWIISADGIHNFGQRLLIGRTVGTILNPHFTPPTTDNLVSIEPSGKAWYDGLLVSVRKRQTKVGWLQWGFNVGYTLSKAFNYFDDDQIPFNVEQQVNPNNLSLEKGPAPTDERHRFTFYGVFGFPWDFTFSPIWTMASDVPLNLLVPDLGARLPSVSRNAGGRSARTCGDVNRAIDAYNTNGPPPGSPLASIFIPPVACTGTLGDSLQSFDFRLTKAFRLAERHKIDLIMEGFNIFNITNIRGVNNNNFSGFNNAITRNCGVDTVCGTADDVPDANFGTPARTAGGFFGQGGPRAFQFAVRYSF